MDIGCSYGCFDSRGDPFEDRFAWNKLFHWESNKSNISVLKMSWYKKARELTDEEFEEITKPKWQPVKSSFIDAIAYFEPLQLLEVKMRGGREYAFGNVPKSVFDDFMRAESKGEFFNQNIRKKYRQKKYSGNVENSIVQPFARSMSYSS